MRNVSVSLPESHRTKVGLNMFSEDYTKTENINEADAVLVRSASDA